MLIVLGNALIDVGRHVRRLHIETPALDKCSPHDLLILQHCLNLEVFSDQCSVRRLMHPLALSLPPIVPFSHSSISSSAGNHLHNSAPTWSLHTLSGQAHPARQALLTPDTLSTLSSLSRSKNSVGQITTTKAALTFPVALTL